MRTSPFVLQDALAGSPLTLSGGLT